MTDHLLLGQTLRFRDDPFAVPIAEATQISTRGGVLIRNGAIAAVGEAAELRAASDHRRVR